MQVLMHQATSDNKEQSALIGKQAVTHDDNDRYDDSDDNGDAMVWYCLVGLLDRYSETIRSIAITDVAQLVNR